MRPLGVRGLAVCLALAIGMGATATFSATHRPDFPAAPAESAQHAGGEIAVLAGGCFWGMEGLFEHVRGVHSVTAGYAGGSRTTASYQQVSSERTNHAESIRISFDPKVVSFGQLLRIYFAVAHDPTQLNGQYPDEGRSYRSAIFPQNPEQRKVAGDYIAMLNRSHIFPKPIATSLEVGAFFPAEAEHQQFMRNHPTHPYIVRWDQPRLRILRERFPDSFQ